MSLLTFFAVVQSPAPSAPARFEQWWPEVVARLERGVTSDQAQDLREAQEICLKGLSGSLEPRQVVLTRYAIAYAIWRLVRVPKIDREERLPLLNDAVAQLKQAVAVDPRYAEAHAMLAGIYGSQMSFAPALGVDLGPEAGAALEQAVKLAPDNPRVVFLEGSSAYHTPPAYGGSVEKAEALFRRAINLFESEPRDRPWPNWGRTDVHVWLGQLLEKRGDREAARAEYNKALELAPDFRWVRFMLLPRLDRKPPERKPN